MDSFEKIVMEPSKSDDEPVKKKPKKVINKGRKCKKRKRRRKKCTNVKLLELLIDLL